MFLSLPAISNEMYFFQFSLFFFHDCFDLIVFAFFFDNFLVLLIHGIFPADVVLNCLDVLQNLIFVLPIVIVEVVVVRPYPFL